MPTFACRRCDYRITIPWGAGMHSLRCAHCGTVHAVRVDPPPHYVREPVAPPDVDDYAPGPEFDIARRPSSQRTAP